MCPGFINDVSSWYTRIKEVFEYKHSYFGGFSIKYVDFMLDAKKVTIFVICMYTIIFA